MQPNQQNPYSQPTPPPSPTGYAGSNVPDFLQLDPIPEPKTPRSKKRIIMAAMSILIVLGLVAGGVGYWLWQQGESERRFYAALGNMLEVASVSREYTIMVNDDEVMSASAKTDLSVPAQPRSHIAYTLLSTDDAAGKGEMHLKGEIIAIGNKEFYSRFDTISGVSGADRVVLGRWSKFSLGDNSFASQLVDPNEAINTTFGNVLVGSYDSQKKDQLMRYIKSQRPYRVLDYYNDKINERPAQAYIVEVDSQEVGKLNKKAAEILEVAVPFPFNFTSVNDSKKIKITFWTDNDSGKLLKIKEQQKSSEVQDVQTRTVYFDYPNNVTIAAPKDM